MKEKIVLLIVFIFLVPSLYSIEIDTGLSLGVIGLGGNINHDNIRDAYLYGRFLTFSGELTNGFGFTFSPFVFFANFWTSNSETNFSGFEKSFLYFANPSIYYNFFNNDHYKALKLGPFISINALEVNKPNKIIYNSGIVFTINGAQVYMENETFFKPELINVEVGYSYENKNKHGVYGQISFDLITACFIYFGGRQ